MILADARAEPFAAKRRKIAGHIDQLILQWKAGFALARVASTPAVSQGLAHPLLIRNAYVVLLVLLK